MRVVLNNSPSQPSVIPSDGPCNGTYRIASIPCSPTFHPLFQPPRPLPRVLNNSTDPTSPHDLRITKHDANNEMIPLLLLVVLIAIATNIISTVGAPAINALVSPLLPLPVQSHTPADRPHPSSGTSTPVSSHPPSQPRFRRQRACATRSSVSAKNSPAPAHRTSLRAGPKSGGRSTRRWWSLKD